MIIPKPSNSNADEKIESMARNINLNLTLHQQRRKKFKSSL